MNKAHCLRRGQIRCGKNPDIDPSAFIAPSADIYGDVSIAENCSIWFHATVRAGAGSVSIGAGTNVQDNCVIHVDKGYSVTVGKKCHDRAQRDCARLQRWDNTLIGMGAIVLNARPSAKNCIVGAGALVTQNMQIPEGSLVYGSPAKIIRSVTEAEITSNLENAAHYVREGQEYAKHLGKRNAEP